MKRVHSLRLIDTHSITFFYFAFFSLSSLLCSFVCPSLFFARAFGHGLSLFLCLIFYRFSLMAQKLPATLMSLPKLPRHFDEAFKNFFFDWEDTDSCWSGYSSGFFFFKFQEPFAYFYFFQERRPPRVEFYFTFLQQAQLHAATKWSALEEEQGSHTNPASSSSLQFVFLVPSRRVARARLGTHSCASPREKEECTVDSVCHVSLRAGMCLPGKPSDVTHSMSPTPKSERPHETKSETHNTHNTQHRH